MRVLLVSPYDYAMPGGVTEHVAQLDAALRLLGNETTVVAPISIRPGIPRPASFVPIGRVIRVPTNGSVARITLSIGISRKVQAVLREMEPDIVHVHEPFMPLLPYVALRHSTAVNVATFHAFSGNGFGYRHFHPVLERYFRKLDGQIAVSETARSFVSRYFQARYAVIPNGVSLQRFRDASPLSDLRDGKVNILFVGRLDERKGFDVLLKAFARLRRRHATTRLVVVGPYDPKQQAHYRRMITRVGISDVVFAGFAAPGELARYYASSDVVCAPSLGGESFGIVLLEAMAAGKPIVASNIPGYREVVDEGEQGLLVAPGDADALCSVLDDLVTDPARRVSLGERGRIKAEGFAWPIVAGRVVDYYRRALNGTASVATTSTDCFSRTTVPSALSLGES